MNVDIIQADYEQLESIASRFGQQADSNSALLSRLNQTVEQLRGAGWEGQAANDFFKEMHGEIFPAMQRLTGTLEQGQAVTLKAKVIFQQAEEEAAALFGGEDDGRNISREPQGEDGNDILSNEFPIDVPTLGEGLVGTIELILKTLEKHGRKVPDLGSFGPILGIIFDSWGNPDSDWLKSVGSSLIENVGIDLIALKFPPVAIAMALSDVVQLVGDGTEAFNNWAIGQMGLTPELSIDLRSISGRYFQNIDRLNLSNISEPLADIIYDFAVTPYVDAIGRAWNDPSVNNLLYLGAVAFAPPGIKQLLSADSREGIWQGIQDTASGTGNFLLGALDMQASFTELSLGYGGAAVTKITDFLPIPVSMESRIDNMATEFVDRIDEGIIPGINVPGLPFV